MSEEKKIDIAETVDVLEGLDKQSLLIIQAGAQMLKSRQDMDEPTVESELEKSLLDEK